MTRVLVLGNSHAATLRRAFPAIGAAYPGLALSFWGLPGGAFAKASTDAEGKLRPDPTDRVSLRKGAQWNDQDHVDLTAYDRIFLVGLRFNLHAVLTICRALQPLDRGPREGALGVSDGFLRAALRAEVDAALNAQLARTPLDSRVTLMPAPYPAARAVQRGSDLFEPVTATVAQLEDAALLMALYEAEIIQAAGRRGLALALQPRSTLARPFLTQDSCLEDPDRDVRHMNADFGLRAFDALLATAPPSHPAAAAAAPTTA